MGTRVPQDPRLGSGVGGTWAPAASETGAGEATPRHWAPDPGSRLCTQWVTRCLVPCLCCPQWGERRRPAGGCSGRGGLITPLAHSVTSGKCSKQQDGDKVPGGGGGDGDPVPHEWVRGQASGFPPPRARAPRESRRRRLRVTLGTRCRGRLAAVSPRAGGRALCPRGGGGSYCRVLPSLGNGYIEGKELENFFQELESARKGAGVVRAPPGCAPSLFPPAPAFSPAWGGHRAGWGGQTLPSPLPASRNPSATTWVTR